MTALVTADLHLSEKPRDAYRFKAMERIADLVEKHKVTELLILGDLTESKDYHPATLVNDVVDVIYSLSCMTQVIVLTGNHDYTQTDCPFFHFLRRFKRIQWVNAVKTIELSIGRCLFLPHTRDYAKEWEGVFDDKALEWIFPHNTFEGAETEHGKKLSGIPTDIFPDDIPIVSGDIHTPQMLGPVTYVGSPYTVDFGDDFDPRVLLLSNKGMKSIPLPGPQKRLLDLKVGFNLKKLDLEPGDIVKVRYTLKPDEKPDWIKIKEQIKEQLTKFGVTVHLVQPELSETKTQHVDIKRVETKSDERIVQEFGTQRKIVKATLEAGMGLLKEA